MLTSFFRSGKEIWSLIIKFDAIVWSSVTWGTDHIFKNSGSWIKTVITSAPDPDSCKCIVYLLYSVYTVQCILYRVIVWFWVKLSVIVAMQFHHIQYMVLICFISAYRDRTTLCPMNLLWPVKSLIETKTRELEVHHPRSFGPISNQMVLQRYYNHEHTDI